MKRAAIVLIPLTIVSVSAQAPADPARTPTAAQRVTLKDWTPPRTPWGDPDLQGVFANDNEYATPLERPDEFAGRTMQDLTPSELAKMRQEAERRMVAALPGGRVRGPDDWWLQNLDLSKRSQPWLIVDPPDGRIPPLTPEGQKRIQAAGRPRGTFVGGPFDGPQDFSLLDRCITRGVPGSMIPVMYGNTYEIIQAPGYVAITYEIVHESRIIPLDGRPHVRTAIRQHMGDPRGRWEGNTLVVETTKLYQRGRLSPGQRRHASRRRALYPRRAGPDCVDRNNRRSVDVDAAVDSVVTSGIGPPSQSPVRMS